MGPITQAAIKKFQEANGLASDGIVGPKTKLAMATALQGGPASGGKPAASAARAAQAAAAASRAGAASDPSKAKPLPAFKRAGEVISAPAGLDPSKVKPLPVRTISVKPGGETGKLMDLAQSLDSIQQIKGDYPDGAHYHITIAGKQVEINQKEVDTNRKNAQAAFAKAVKSLKDESSDALEWYNSYRSTITTGKVGKVITWFLDEVAVTDPGGEVRFLCTMANTDAVLALGSANGNSYVSAAKALITGDTAAHKAKALTWAYKEGIESSAEKTVTVLEGVKTASEFTLAVGGAVVTGGATVAFAGGLAITAAGDLSPALYGRKVDWGKFPFDRALGVALKKLGPGEQIEKAVLAKLGTQAAEKVGEKALKEAVAKVVGSQTEALLKKSLETTQKVLSGKDVTWENFTEEVKKEMEKELAKVVLVGVLKK